MQNQKKIIKLYKSGKLWVTAAIVVGGMIVSTTVSADTNGEAVNVNMSTHQDTTAQKSLVSEQTPSTDEAAKSSVSEQTQPTDEAAKSSVNNQTQSIDETAKSSVSEQPQSPDETAKTSVDNQPQSPDETTNTSVDNQTVDTAESTTKSSADAVAPSNDIAVKTSKSSQALDQTASDTQTTWERDKSAQTNNSDNNPVSNEAGEYWPDTKGQSIKDYDKTETRDLLQTTTFTDGYNPTPVLKQSSDLSLYVSGQKVDIGTLKDDDSLGTAKAPNSEYPGHSSSGHSRLLKTSDLGQDTYFYAKDVMRIKNQDTNKYESYDMRWTLQSVNYGNEQSMIALGIKGTIDGGGTTLLNVGSGWQMAQLGNFFNTHIQFFKNINYADQNEQLTPDEAISKGLVEAAAVLIHFGVSDIDASEAIEITDSVIKKVYVDNESQLAYQKTDDGYLAVTRKYDDPSDVSDVKGATSPVNEKKVTVLFEMDVPKEGFDYSIATIGTKKNNDGEIQLGQGSKVDPSLLSTMKYEEPLSVNFQDQQGNQLIPSKADIGIIGNKYNTDITQPVQIPGYHLVKTLGKADGVYVDGNNEITHVYAKDQGNLVVNYVDESGNVLATADKTTADTNQDYTTEPKAIDGYDLVPEKTTGDVTGQYPADGETKEVTYVYGQQGQHTTNYVDEDGKTLVPTDTTKGPKDTDYTTTPAEIPGYHLVPDKTTGDETGKYDTGKKTETTYVYAKDQGNLVVNYVDENGNVLSPADKTTADTNQVYTTEPKSIDGYDLVPTKTAGDVTGQYPENGETKEVTYVYGKQGQHTTNYVDEDGHVLVPAEQTQGPKDTDYTTIPAEIPGYHVVPEKTIGDETGKYDTGKTTETTYVYAKDQGSLVVNYVGEAGNVLSPSDSSTQDSGEAYITTPKSIDGYDFVPEKTTGDVTGQYPANGQTKEVTYVYGQQGQHTTNYVDENGNVLVPAEQTQGSKDTDYTITPAEIPGYHLVPEKTTGDNTGKYDTGKTTDTTYVYAKDQGSLVVNYVDESDAVLSPAEKTTADTNQDYTTTPKSIDGYDLVPEKTTGDVTGQYPANGQTKEVTYVYGQQGQHTTNYVDENGNVLVPAEQTQGPKDTDYTTSPTEIPGYHLVPEKTTGDEIGKYDTGKTTETTYVYAKDQGSLVVNYVDENGSVLLSADLSTKDSGEAYTTTPKSIDGYDLVPSKTTGDVTGQYPADGETKVVTYVYGKQGQHTTNYVDEDGKTLVPTDTTKGPKDTDYQTTPAEIPGYHVVPNKTTGDETGKYDTGKTTETTYVYAKDQGNLVVNYVDENSVVLSPADSSTQDSGETYTTTPKVIDGYDLVPTKTAGDVTGQYPENGETKEVTYVYGKQGQHTTNYVDEDGKTLVPAEQTQGPKDTDYTATPAEIPGYHLVPEKTTGDETGKYDTGKTTDTTYVYAKDQGNLVVNYVDESGAVLSPADSSTQDSGEEYTTTPKNIDGYDLVPSKTTGDVTGQYPNDGETKEVTYVYGKQGQHTTNYVDENGNVLVPAEHTQGPKDTNYTTTPAEIPGYHVVPEKTTGDETVKYDTGKTTDTTYVYAKDQGNLIVNYVDESGQAIAGKESSTKNSGEDYTTTPKNIDGYDLVPSKTTGNINGQYPTNGQTAEVTYVYGKQGQHTTNYVDEDGKTLVPTDTTNGPKDTNYTTTPTKIPGYHLVPEKTTGDNTGKYDTGKTTDTTYVYAKDQGNLVVNYVDESGNVLSSANSSTKNSGEDYTTTPKNIDGYDLVPEKTTGDVTGQYPNDGETKEVTYVYGKQGQHKTNYVDEDGKTLVPAEQTQGPKDTDYTAIPAEIPGYHLVPEKTTGDETGKYDTGKTTDTTYVYAKDQGNLVVNYVDENGNVLSPADSSTQDSGETYTTTPKVIDGYDLVPTKTTGDITGQYPADGETKDVTYVYGQQGQHTTNYVDEAGHVLVPTEHTQGPKDTDYQTTPAEISGYHVVPDKTTGDETGKYDTGKTTDTTYVYAKDQGNLIVNYVDESGQVIAGKESSTQNSGEDYTTTPKNIDGYDLVPNKTTGDVTGQYPANGETNEVTYVYGKQGQHTTNYVDEDGKTLVPTDTTKGPKDTGYTTTPAEIPGYHLVPEKTTGDETGKYDTGKTTDTTYVYAKDQGTKPEENVVEKNSNQKQDDHEFVLNNNQVMQDKAQSDNLIKKEVPEKSVKQLPKTGEETQPHNTITMILGLALSTLGLTMFDKKRKNK
ncbi:MucBP domain-containing protein [Leuconostoc kimchii]|uniref:LPXTG cell wall anchor domain-containing protein n=1 Tax=Leuconostoc kimchii TaxID=136609 RepID=A0ABX5SMS2_9LACO|nr:MucBP domain-containing protein [Leuconostoc kimchii]QBR47833.1 LPXTG cell wall anchor domain-containing protein [Leuconostoc kimchii]